MYIVLIKCSLNDQSVKLKDLEEFAYFVMGETKLFPCPTIRFPRMMTNHPTIRFKFGLLKLLTGRCLASTLPLLQVNDNYFEQIWRTQRNEFHT